MHPGSPRWDWTRNKQATKAMLEGRLKKTDNKKMSPLERMLFKLCLGLTVLAALGYALWDVFIK